MEPVVIAAAAVFLLLGIAMLSWALLGQPVGRRHSLLVMAWLCMALTTTLVIFSIFPTTTASGTAMGVGLGGAGAFVMLVWLSAVRAGDRADAADRSDVDLAERDRQIALLRERLAAVEPTTPPRALLDSARYEYRVAGRRRHVIGIVAGDIRQVTDIDVWVNPENTDMEMSRFYERSLSALIRYGGARKDGSGHVLDDTVHDELAALKQGPTAVMAGTVLVTGAGELSRHHHVRHIFHVAAVHGEPASGYRQVAHVGGCMSSILHEMQSRDLRSVLVPLLGTGMAGGDPATTAAALVSATINGLAATPSESRSVYLLAYTDVELAACRAALDRPDLRQA